VLAAVGVPICLKLHPREGSVWERLKTFDWFGSFIFIAATTSFLIPVTWVRLSTENTDTAPLTLSRAALCTIGFHGGYWRRPAWVSLGSSASLFIPSTSHPSPSSAEAFSTHPQPLRHTQALSFTALSSGLCYIICHSTSKWQKTIAQSCPVSQSSLSHLQSRPQQLLSDCSLPKLVATGHPS
jgi:hypothetical protein